MKIFSSFILFCSVLVGLVSSTDISNPVKLTATQSSPPSLSPSLAPATLSQLCSIGCFGLNLQPQVGRNYDACVSNCNSLGALAQISCNVLYPDTSSQYNCLFNKVGIAVKAYVSNSPSPATITSLTNDWNKDINNYVNRNKAKM